MICSFNSGGNIKWVWIFLFCFILGIMVEIIAPIWVYVSLFFDNQGVCFSFTGVGAIKIMKVGDWGRIMYIWYIFYVVKVYQTLFWNHISNFYLEILCHALSIFPNLTSHVKFVSSGFVFQFNVWGHMLPKCKSQRITSQNLWGWPPSTFHFLWFWLYILSSNKQVVLFFWVLNNTWMLLEDEEWYLV